jgi:hypothetical protein
MRPIDKFILHVVHNWTNELNEAYSEKAIKDFIKYFQDQADELNTEIPDESTLRRYINTFDTVRAKLPSTEQDLRQYNLPDLIAIATSVEDKNASKEQIDITPDVVFPKPGDPIPNKGEPGYGIVIYNGSTEENCILYGKGEKWCITRTSFPTYRLSKDRYEPTFYLARNTNLDTSNKKLSFVAIQVRNPEKTNPDERYVYTPRDNSPNESRPMSFEQLLREVPWLTEITNLESILEYKDLTPVEKVTQQYRGNAIPIEDWLYLDFNTKQGYLIARKGKDLFSDISKNDFIRDYLPNYPKLEEYISKNYGILPAIDVLRNLNYFKKEGNKKSVIINLQEKIDTNELSKSTIPFNIKQELVKYDRWDTASDTRLYNTTFNNNPAIAELDLDKYDGEININLYLKTKRYPKIKAKEKYIADYPQLDRLPFVNLLWASIRGIITKDKFNSTLEAAKDDPKSPFIVKDKENGKLVLDSTSYDVYDLEGEAVNKVPSDDNVAQEVLSAAVTNPKHQDNTVDIIRQGIKDNGDIPSRIDREAFTSTIENTPYNKRIVQDKKGNQLVILKPENEPDDTNYSLFLKNINDKTDLKALYAFGNSRNWGYGNPNSSMSQSMFASYFKYLRSVNQPYTDDELMDVMNSGYDNTYKKSFIKANPPLDPNGQFAVAEYNGDYYIINKQNPSASKKLSTSTRRSSLLKATVPPALLRQVLGQTATPTPTPRPTAPTTPAAPAAPATPAAQAVPAAAAPAAGNAVDALIAAAGLTVGFNDLPTAVRQRIQAGTVANPRTERTAISRNGDLGARGNVTGVVVSGQSKMVIIQLASGRNIAQISIQPEARHYIVTSTTSFNMGRVGNFINSLDQRNLNETIRSYVKRNPHQLNKVREILRRYVNETKKY